MINLKSFDTAPEFEIAPVGSYSSGSFKNAFQITSKNPTTGSTVITSGIVGSNSIISSHTNNFRVQFIRWEWDRF